MHAYESLNGQPEPQHPSIIRADPNPPAAFDWEQRCCPKDPAFDGAAVLAGPAFDGQERDSAIMRFVALAKHRGLSPSEIAEAMAADPWLADKLQSKRTYPSGEDEAMWQTRECWQKIAYEPAAAAFDAYIAQPEIADAEPEAPQRVIPGSEAAHLAPLWVERHRDDFRFGPEFGWLVFTDDRGWVDI